MKTIIELEEALAIAAIEKAGRMKVSFEQFVVEAIRSSVGSKSSEERSPVAIELPIYHGAGGLLPGVDPTSNRSMFEAIEESRRMT